MGLLSKAVDFVAEHSTTILTVGAVVGVVGTAVTSWYAAKKTKEIKEDIEEEKGEEPTKSEVMKEAWPYYVAPITLGTLTIVSIIALNAEHDKKYAALLGAYTLAKADKEKADKKLKEMVGKEKADQIKESLGIKKDIPDDADADLIVPKDDKKSYEKEWWVDTETGVRFWASEHDIDVATVYMSEMVSGEEEPTLVDFYECLGVTNDMCPDVAQSIVFGIGRSIPTIKPKKTSVYDGVEHKAYRAIMYRYNMSSRYED